MKTNEQQVKIANFVKLLQEAPEATDMDLIAFYAKGFAEWADWAKDQTPARLRTKAMDDVAEAEFALGRARQALADATK